MFRQGAATGQLGAGIGIGSGAEPRIELSPWDVHVVVGCELVALTRCRADFVYSFFVFFFCANGVARLGNPLQVVVVVRVVAAVAVVVCLLHVIGRGPATAGGT